MSKNPHAADRPRLLDRVLPCPMLSETDSVELPLAAEDAYDLVRWHDYGKSPLVRALFGLRTLPEHLGGGARPGPFRFHVDSFESTAERPGFQVLAEEASHELVVGAIGKVWRLAIPFVHVAGENEFARFAAPGFVKVAWSLHVEPLTARRSRVTFEVRAEATDPSSARKFRRYFRIIGPWSRLVRRTLLRALAVDAGDTRAPDGWRDVLAGIGGAGIMAAAFATPFLRRERCSWGVDPELAARALPGDGLIAEPRWSWTHGIEIDAAAEEVWPWIAQVGADRAGFYSYQWLENLAGCHLRNAAEVHPEWELHVGEGMMLHPKAPAMTVVELVPGRALVLFGAPDAVAQASGKPWIAASWLFHLEPLGARRCRLVSRYRCATSNDLGTRLRFGPLFVEPIGFAMDRRMLAGVKARAEQRQQEVT